MFVKAKIISIGKTDGYHDERVERGSKKYVASSSMLREFLFCAERWREGYKPADSKAKLFGSLVDCMIMTPDEFDDRYPVHPDTYKNKKGEVKPWRSNATECAEWLESCEEHQEPISESLYTDILAACERMRDKEIIKLWIESSQKQVWIEAVWVCPITKLEIPVKALLDFVPMTDSIFRDCLGDLKCVRNGSKVPFKKQVTQFGWNIQAALYRDIFNATTELKRSSYCFLGVENIVPFQPFRYMLAQERPDQQELIAIGQQRYRRALELYAKALISDEWPGYNDDKESQKTQGWTILHADPWDQFEEESSRAEQLYDEEVENQEHEQNNDVPTP